MAPQTRQTENKCVPPYFYKDSLLSGFRGTHWLSGSCTQDYGSFTIMPVPGQLKTAAADHALSFSHNNEVSTPAYYKLSLPANNITTELSSSLRCGIMQFTMLADDSLYLLVVPNSDQQKGFVQINAAAGEIWGYNPAQRIYQGWGKPAGFNGWFYIKIEQPVSTGGTFRGKEIFTTNSIRDQKESGGFVGFYLRKGEQLRIKTGTSFVASKESNKI